MKQHSYLQFYTSWGRGGGTGDYKARNYNIPYTNGQINFDQIYANNLTAPGGIGSQPTNMLIRSMNNHAWYGVVSNLKKKSIKT